MKLGFVTAILPELSLEEVLDFAAATGYECVEVMCWPPGKADRRYAGVTHIDVTTLDVAAAKRIRELAAAKKVEISGLGYYPNVLTPDAAEAEATRRHLEQVIRAAPKLGLDRVINSTSIIGEILIDILRSCANTSFGILPTSKPIDSKALKSCSKFAGVGSIQKSKSAE